MAKFPALFVLSFVRSSFGFLFWFSICLCRLAFGAGRERKYEYGPYFLRIAIAIEFMWRDNWQNTVYQLRIYGACKVLCDMNNSLRVRVCNLRAQNSKASLCWSKLDLANQTRYITCVTKIEGRTKKLYNMINMLGQQKQMAKATFYYSFVAVIFQMTLFHLIHRVQTSTRYTSLELQPINFTRDSHSLCNHFPHTFFLRRRPVLGESKQKYPIANGRTVDFHWVHLLVSADANSQTKLMRWL